MARNALGYEFGSAARLYKRPGSVWNCLWGKALKRSPGIIRKSRVSYPGPGFPSSATWPSLPIKHYNRLINQSINQSNILVFRIHRIPNVWMIVISPATSLTFSEILSKNKEKKFTTKSISFADVKKWCDLFTN